MKHQESVLQQQIIEWCNWNLKKYPELEFLHHSPNGGKRSAREGARFKREGVRAGFPDLMLPVARKGYYGLYIELKVGNGKQSESQKKWEKFLLNNNDLYKVCKSFDETIKLLEWYLAD